MLLREYKKTYNYENYLEQFKLRRTLQGITFEKVKWDEISSSLNLLLQSQYEILNNSILSNVKFVKQQVENVSEFTRASSSEAEEEQKSLGIQDIQGF